MAAHLLSWSSPLRTFGSTMSSMVAGRSNSTLATDAAAYQRAASANQTTRVSSRIEYFSRHYFDQDRPALTVPKIGPRVFSRRRVPNRQKFIEDQKTQGESRILEKYQTRDWRAGDIYTPHDLSAAEMKKWRKRYSPATDAFDSLNMNPLDLYKTSFGRPVLLPPGVSPLISHLMPKANDLLMRFKANKSIFLRSIDDPAIARQYTEHKAHTTVARFSPSGFYVASGDVTGLVRVWDCVGEGHTKGEYSIVNGRINDLAWDGDSQRIIAVGDGKQRYGHCITWDSGNTVGEIYGHTQQINSVSIRQQRPLRAAAAGDDKNLVFYHGAPFKFNTGIRDKHTNYIYGVGFSPDGSTLVSVGADRRIWLYDGKTGEPRGQIGEGEHKGSIFSVSWSKDSRKFVTASADKTVKSHHGSDNGTLWTGSFDGRVCSWDVPTGTAAEVDGESHSAYIAGLAPMQEGNGRIYSVAWDDTIRSMDVGTKTYTGSSSKLSGQPKGIAAAAAVLVGTSESVEIYKDGQKIGDFKSKFPITTVAAHGNTAAIGGDDSTVQICEISGATLIPKTDIKASRNPVSALAFSPNGSLLAVGDSRGRVLVYNVADATLVTDRWTAHTSRITSIAWNENGTHVVSGALDTNIFVWNLANPGEWLQATNAHKEGVNGVAWVSGSKIASAGADAAVKLWKVEGLE
ncbi:putative actin cortical patch component [Aspergillus flavus]|uniref:Actin cortical patch component n=1 Tax=Aspergillus flavus (strain ATCC 200026 / FGSC A1120 / IAM 13836 / NRRL 3357 / JCM 12722 / SRRC 167) TaxID=332952 RepID=A0A7U2MDT3_ASPFN|nr:putative actin cortical patch component [Aspergillus flavus]